MDLNRQLQCFDDDEGDGGMRQLVALDELNQMLNSIQQGEVRLSPFVPSLVRILERQQNHTQNILLAVRALVHIFDLEPRCCALAISEGCVSPLCRQLVALSDLDLAEQCIKCLKLLCQSHSRDVLAGGGLRAIPMFFDFFPQHLQRRALEACALICIECARQAEEAAQVLDALPVLVKIESASADETQQRSLATAFGRMVHSLAATQGQQRRFSQPPHAILKVLHQWNALPARRSAELEYFNVDLTAFAPKVSPKWRDVVLAKLAAERGVVSALGKQRDFSALAKLCNAGPHRVLPQLARLLPGWNFQQELFTNLDALKLIKSMLPFPPNSLQFEDMKRGRDAFDATLECADGEEVILEEEEEVTQKQDVVVILDDEEGEEAFPGTWACDACTFENEPGANSCEICGKLKALGTSSETSTGNGASSLDTPLDSMHILSQDPETAPSIGQIYRQRAYLLPKLFFNEHALFAVLCQVARSSANPEFRIKSLGCLAALLSILPRALLNTHSHVLEGVLPANLTGQEDAHIVASALRLALVVLLRIGLTPQMLREQVPVLIRDCLLRFPLPASGAASMQYERIASLRRRATAWLDLYKSSTTMTTATLEGDEDAVRKRLEEIASTLRHCLPLAAAAQEDGGEGYQQPPMKRHCANKSRGGENDVVAALQSLCTILREEGVLANEFTQSHIPELLFQLLTKDEAMFRRALSTVFASKHEAGASKLVQLLQDSLIAEERAVLPVVEYHAKYRFLLTHDSLVCQPASRALAFFCGLGLEDNSAAFDYSFKVDPLLPANRLEAMLWANIKTKLVDITRTANKPSLKRAAPAPASAQASTNEQAGDAVYAPRLRPGQRVTRGRDWKWQDQDGGAGRIGTVLEVRAWNGIPLSCVRVKWDAASRQASNVYRYTEDEPHAVDLALAPRTRKRPAKPSGLSSAKFIDAEEGEDNALARSKLARGAEIDAMDSFYCWYPAVVRAVVPANKHPAMVRVAFEGFGPRYDEWIPLSSWRLAPRKSRVFENGGFARGQVDDYGAEVFKRDEESDLRPVLPTTSLSEYLDERTGLVLRTGMELVFKRKDGSGEEEEEEAIVLQLKVERPTSTNNNGASAMEEEGEEAPESKLDDAEEEDADAEEGKPIPVEHILVQLAKPREEEEEQEEEEDEDAASNNDDEEEEKDMFDVEWVSLASLIISPSMTKNDEEEDEQMDAALHHLPFSLGHLRRASSTTAAAAAAAVEEEDFVHVGARCFAKVSIANKEAWIPVRILARKEGEGEPTSSFPVYLAQTQWGGGEHDEEFSVAKTMLQRVPPRGAFAPSLQEMRILVKMFYEFAERSNTGPSSRAENAGEEDVDAHIEEEEEEEEEEEDGAGDLTMMAASPPAAPAVAKPSFNAARARTLNRHYPLLDLAASDSRLGAMFGMASAAAMLRSSTQQQQQAEEDVDTPVRLVSRVLGEDTVFLCYSRQGASNNHGAITLQYTIDFEHAEFAALAMLGGGGTLTPLCGAMRIAPDTKRISAASSFPTLTYKAAPQHQQEAATAYYEVEIDQCGLAQIGFCDEEFGGCDEDNGLGCGDCAHSWAFDGHRLKLWSEGSAREWGQAWRTGDVLGVGYELLPPSEQSQEDETTREANIYYTLNGKELGQAFERIRFTGHLRPCLSFNRTFTFRAEFAKFKYHAPASLAAPATTPSLLATAAAAAAAAQGSDLPATNSSIFDAAPALSQPAVALLHVLQQGGGEVSLINQSLTNKLSFQLEQVLPVCALAIPRWCFDYTTALPFVFPLSVRLNLFQLTAFGTDRAVAKLCTLGGGEQLDEESAAQQQQQRGSIALKRQKVSLPRAHALEGALQFFLSPPPKTASNARIVYTFDFMGEIGHGHGPTLEFYSLICRELSRKDLGMWRLSAQPAREQAQQLLPSKTSPAMETANEADFQLFCQETRGLFPSLLPPSAKQDNLSKEARREQVLELFYFLGKFLARALMDERPLDLHFSPVFLDMVLGRHVSEPEANAVALREIDPEFARNLDFLDAMGREFESDATPAARKREIAREVEDMCLDNLVPGTTAADGLLLPLGEVVDAQHLVQYCAAVRAALLNVEEQVERTRRGLCDLLRLNTLHAFSTVELVEMFAGGADKSRAWTRQEMEQAMTLREFGKDSPHIQNLLDVLTEFGEEDRKLFLRFLTGSSRLPSIGGWKAFNPRFTVVKKTSNDGSDLPTCSTCKMELKLPCYASKEILRDKLLLAIREGQSYFAMD